MKTIQISEATYEFIKNLAHEIATQDNRITAKPYYFAIEEDEKMYGIHPGWSDEFEWSHNEHGDGYSTEQALEKAGIGDMDRLEEEGWEKFGFVTKKRYHNVFLTEKAAKAHIRANHYHYTNPRDYVFHATRNPEMTALVKAILEIGGTK